MVWEAARHQTGSIRRVLPAPVGELLSVCRQLQQRTMAVLRRGRVLQVDQCELRLSLHRHDGEVRRKPLHAMRERRYACGNFRTPALTEFATTRPARETRLNTLAGKQEDAWRQVGALIDTKRPNDY